jgi:hypothetical protein
MSDGRSDDKAYERARKRVEELRGFYTHLLVYVVVNLGLIILNLLIQERWFIWPLVGWGIGLVIHGAVVFLEGPFGPDWEERKVRQLMERERSRKRPGPPQPQAP